MSQLPDTAADFDDPDDVPITIKGEPFPRPLSASAADNALYFFDSSALVKRHVNELGSRWVRSLTHVKADHTIYLSRITAVEIVSAITRRQRGRSLSVAQGAAILGHFRRHLAQRYNLLELTPPLLVDAMTMAQARIAGLLRCPACRRD